MTFKVSSPRSPETMVLYESTLWTTLTTRAVFLHNESFSFYIARVKYLKSRERTTRMGYPTLVKRL